MTYIAASAAILQLGGTYMGMQAAREASILEGDEFDKTALNTLLTARFNMGNIVQSGIIKQDSILEQAADREAMLAKAGQLRKGKVVATIGGSGVKMDSGTAAQQIIKSGLDNASQILNNQEELTAAISGLNYNVDQQLLETETKALMDFKKLKRMADLAREGGNTAQFGQLMSGLAGAASTYKGMGGNFSEFESKPKQETGGTS